MENAPSIWGMIVHHSTMANIKEAINAVNVSQAHLHEAWSQSRRWTDRDHWRGKGVYTNHCKDLNQENEQWGMSDLEGYIDSDMERNKGAFASSQPRNYPSCSQAPPQKEQSYPFPPQDQMVSGTKQVAGPCYACRSECHWLWECPKKPEFDKLKRKGKVGGLPQAYKIAMHAAAIFKQQQSLILLQRRVFTRGNAGWSFPWKAQYHKETNVYTEWVQFATKHVSFL